MPASAFVDKTQNYLGKVIEQLVGILKGCRTLLFISLGYSWLFSNSTTLFECVVLLVETEWGGDFFEIFLSSSVLTLYGLKSVCIFSILFSSHFLKYLTSRDLVIISFLLVTFHCLIQGWYCKEKLDAGHSKGSRG